MSAPSLVDDQTPSDPTPSDPATPTGAATSDAGLTVRELEVLRGMASGKTNADIGRFLFISEDTVKTHSRRLFRKLGAHDRAHAVALAYQAGLLGQSGSEVAPKTAEHEDPAVVWAADDQPAIPTVTLTATDQDAALLARAVWPQHMNRPLTILRAREALERLTGSAMVPTSRGEAAR